MYIVNLVIVLVHVDDDTRCFYDGKSSK